MKLSKLIADLDPRYLSDFDMDVIIGLSYLYEYGSTMFRHMNTKANCLTAVTIRAINEGYMEIDSFPPGTIIDDMGWINEKNEKVVIKITKKGLRKYLGSLSFGNLWNEYLNENSVVNRL